ncbi:MAG: class I SAM-dependent methyltransferase [Planctomycetes bacterium]|nr:class I SAM-dependent methyltransferase [Planctomycetota bacterium]
MMDNRHEPNPWLSIPSEDYEGHMGHDKVKQLRFLGEVFKELIETYKPRSLVVLGCATGNGFECLEFGNQKHVLGIDLNPNYLKVLKERFGNTVPGLELLCSDLVECTIPGSFFDLIHAALVLEYVDPALVVEKAVSWLKPGGVFTVVLQMPCNDCDKVSDTGFESLKLLDSIMKLVEPETLDKLADRSGFHPIESKNMTLESGKSFYLGVYQKK